MLNFWMASMSGEDMARIEKLRNHDVRDYSHISSHGSKHSGGHEAPWIAYLQGDYPDYPVDILRHNHAQVRQRLPWQTLATGEHWYTTVPFQHAASRHLVDIFQPDIHWVGGLTAITKICAIAEAAGISVIPHGGGNTPYGQHACYALPAIPWTECFVAAPPGVPPEDAVRLPGASDMTFFHGRWHDEVVRTAVGWRIRELRLEVV